MLGVDFDNDSLFMNDLVVGWCWAERLEVTRSRAYRKNDQAWVEQKNGAVVRRVEPSGSPDLVGYGRFEGVLAGEALGRLYAAARLHGNLLQPSFKLREKRREGARVIKRYHALEPPAVWALAHTAVSDADKARLRAMLAGAGSGHRGLRRRRSAHTPPLAERTRPVPSPACPLLTTAGSHACGGSR